MNSYKLEWHEVDWDIFLPIILPILLISTVLVVIALVDLYFYRGQRENKLIWVLVIIFLNIIGPVLYLTIGRKRG